MIGATGVDMGPHCYRVHFGVDIEATGADMGIGGHIMIAATGVDISWPHYESKQTISILE